MKAEGREDKSEPRRGSTTGHQAGAEDAGEPERPTAEAFQGCRLECVMETKTGIEISVDEGTGSMGHCSWIQKGNANPKSAKGLGTWTESSEAWGHGEGGIRSP